MTQAERYTWLSLVVWGLVLFVLLSKFTAGIEVFGQTLGFEIVERPAAQLLVTYVMLGVIAGFGEGLLMAVMAPMTGGDIPLDERDKAIEARANLVSYWFMAAGLHVLLLHLLANAAFKGHLLPWIDLSSLTGIAFALLLVLVLAEIVKRVALIWQYRSA